MPQRNYTIDLLRFLASSIVVLFHLNESITYINNPYRNLVKLGWVGVPAFFVISGFCIAMAACHSKNFTDFIVRRVFRIFPLYWFSLFVVILVVLFWAIVYGQNSVARLPKSPASCLATIFLLTSPLSNVATINWVYWSLTFEIFFYAVVAFSILIKSGIVRSIFILSVSVASLFVHLREMPLFFFLQHWPAFGLGFALYKFKVDAKDSFFPIVLLIVNLTGIFFAGQKPEYVFVAIITATMVGVSIFVRDIPKNFFSRLGDYSYGVYLLHVPIGCYLLMQLKVSIIQQNILYNSAFDLSILIIMVFIGHFCYRWVEKPGIRFGKWFTKNKRFINTVLVG